MTNGAIETISLLVSNEKRDILSVEQTTQKRLGTVLFYGIVVALAYFVFLVFQPFLPALAWAVVIVVVSYPAYLRLRARFHANLAALICTAGITVILIVPTLLVMAAFVQQGVQAVQTCNNKSRAAISIG